MSVISTETGKEQFPDADVPLEHQTKESLIAYIQSLEKEAKQDEERRAALEEIARDATGVIETTLPKYSGEGSFEHVHAIGKLSGSLCKLDPLTSQLKKEKT